MLAITPARRVEPITYTIADAIKCVRTWSDVLPTRQRDMISALMRAAQVTRLQPGAVQFTPANLRATLLGQPAAALGVTDATFRNIRSHLKAVGLRLGIIEAPETQQSLEWTTLLSLLSGKKALALISFGRFCTAQRIAPVAVDDDVVRQVPDLADRPYLRDQSS